MLDANNNSNNNDTNSDPEFDSLKQIIKNKVKEKKNQIHPLHAVLITEVEILLWVLYVIRSVEEEKAEASNKPTITP
jgi:uncharacterized protein with PQ loop repeat